MAEDQYTKVLEIQLNYEKAIQGIAEYERQIQSAKQQQEAWRKDLKSLEKDFNNGKISADEFSESQKQITEQMAASKVVTTQLKKEQADLTKQLRQEVKAENAQSDSLVQLRARLSNLTAEYDELSGAERNAAKGEELKSHILEVTAEIKEAEFATERFYRNVGNYEKSSEDALGALRAKLEESKQKYKELVATEGEASEAAKKLKAEIEAQEVVIDKTGQYIMKLQSSIIPFGDKIIPLLSKGLGGVKEAFSLAGQGAQILGKQLLALMANPIVAFLAILATAIAAVAKGISGSEENMNKWNKIMAPLTRALSVLQSGIETICGWILNFAEGVGFLAGKLLEVMNIATGGLFDPIIQSANEAIELTEREQKLAKDQREFMVQQAKDELEISKLKKEASDKSNKDYESRLAAAKKANELELGLANERRRLAKEEYEQAKARAEWTDNTAEDNKELARLEAAMYNAEKEYYDNTKRLQSQINEMQSAYDAERKKAAEDAAKIAKERSDKELSAIRSAEDAMLALIKDTAEQRRRQIQLSYEREIEDLKARLETEKNLTAAARDAITQTIAAKQQQMANDLAELDAQISQEEIAREQQKIQLKLDAVKEGTDQEFALRMQQLELQKQADLAQTDQEIANIEEREEMKALIVAKYAAQQQALRQEQDLAILENEKQAIENMFTERMMQAEMNSVEQAQIELEQRQMALDNLHQMEGESNEAFRARELEAEKDFNESKKKLANVEKSVELSRLNVAKSVTGGIISTFDALGQENVEFAKLSKVLALADIAISTGKAIAEGTAQAQSVPYPANLAAIATTVATVLANIATAISTVKSAKFAKGGKVDANEIYHANGGKIRGAGTGTSDSIPAMLSNGEFVMTANATRLFEPILTQMNDIGRGVTPQLSAPFSMSSASPDLLSESLAASVAEIHPVVSVVDINEGRSRVEVIESLDTI